MNFDTPQREFNNRPTVFYVSRLRKDGKHMVTFCYWSKQIKKLQTPEQVETYRTDPSYQERQ